MKVVDSRMVTIDDVEHVIQITCNRCKDSSTSYAQSAAKAAEGFNEQGWRVFYYEEEHWVFTPPEVRRETGITERTMCPLCAPRVVTEP